MLASLFRLVAGGGSKVAVKIGLLPLLLYLVISYLHSLVAVVAVKMKNFFVCNCNRKRVFY